MDFAPLLEPFDASVDPAFDIAAFDGFPMIITPFRLGSDVFEGSQRV
ncbi:hypothetical protein FHR89_002947 [Cellulomonas uda]|nr:hypothetical protein [Cellulomonas uda]